MRNRAKCKLCNSVIESYHKGDYVNCKCGEISISGGNHAYECYANDWKNFIRVDDQDNEILVSIKDDVTANGSNQEELMSILNEMIKNIENLPQDAMTSYINHYDYLTLMIMVRSIYLKLDEKKNI